MLPLFNASYIVHPALYILCLCVLHHMYWIVCWALPHSRVVHSWRCLIPWLLVLVLGSTIDVDLFLAG